MNKSNSNKKQILKKTPIKPQYLRLDEKINAIDYLERAYEFIQQVENDNVAWKWVVNTLNGALYGFAVCACAGTSPDLVAPKIKRLQQR